MIVFDRDGNFLRILGRGQYSRARTACIWPPTTPIWLTDDGDHTVRQCTLDGKILLELGIPGQPGALYERRAVPPLHPHRAVAAGRHLRRRTATATRGCTNTRPTAAADVAGASPAPTPASSTSSTTSAATPTAGSMSPTARTTASRCSTATAATRRSGTTCTAPARLYMPRGKLPGLLRRRTRARASASTATCPISARGCRSSTTPASASRRIGGQHAGPRPRRVHRPARHRRRQPRRHLCRRGVLDPIARSSTPDATDAGRPPLAAQIPQGAPKGLIPPSHTAPPRRRGFILRRSIRMAAP